MANGDHYPCRCCCDCDRCFERALEHTLTKYADVWQKLADLDAGVKRIENNTRPVTYSPTITWGGTTSANVPYTLTQASSGGPIHAAKSKRRKGGK